MFLEFYFVFSKFDKTIKIAYYCQLNQPINLMRQFLFILAFVGCFAVGAAAQSAKKGTHQAFLTEGISRVRINVDPSLIKIQPTRSTRVLVEANITINGSMPLLDYAIGTGRYNLTAVMEGDVLTITPNERKQAIIIRGEEIQEEINYTIYMPEHLEQKNTTETVE